jgi:hypothetical protein
MCYSLVWYRLYWRYNAIDGNFTLLTHVSRSEGVTLVILTPS